MIDWDRVRALRQEVGEEDFDEVVELFLHEVDEEIATLAEHNEPEMLVERLHFLKGSALSLGFSDFSKLCQAGEAGLMKDSNSQIDITMLCDSYKASRAAFLDMLPTRFPG